MKELLKLIFIIIITFLFVVIASSLFFWFFEMKFFILPNNFHGDGLSLEYNIYYYVAITVVTIAIAVIAWVQLTKLHKSSQINYLLEFDKKWGSEEIIQARALIHQSYVRYQNLERAEMYQAIGAEIIEWSKSSSEFEPAKNFMYVLSLLNFFETVGYIHNEAGKTSSQIDKLMGQSIRFYYKIFEPYIIYRRNKHGVITFHREFSKLYEDLDQPCSFIKFIKKLFC